MKIVINKSYGGFCIDWDFVKKHNLKPTREDERLVTLIESGIDTDSTGCDFEVVDIPNEATDYTVVENDVSEYVIYVLDGKIHYIFPI